MNVSFLSPTYVGSHNPPPLGAPTSSLAHRPVSGSDTICNSSSSPLVDIVLFSLLSIVVNLTVLKRVSVSFLSPTDVGSHNPPPLGGPTSSLAHRPVSSSNSICNSSNSLLVYIIIFSPLHIVVSLTILKRVC